MKKITAAILALAIATALFSGCSEGDAALYGALKKSGAADSVTKTTVTTYSISDLDPFFAEPETDMPDLKNSLEEANGRISELKLFGEDFSITSVTKAKDGAREISVDVSKPDFDFNLSLWAREAEVIAKIPDFIAPYIPVREEYLLLDANKLPSALLGIDFGTDGKTFRDLADKLADAFAARLSYPLVSETETEGGSAVYTVRLDREALAALADNSIDVLSSDEISALICTGIFILDISDGEPSSALRDDYASAMAEAKASLTEIFADDGYIGDNESLTLKFTVGADGLVSRSEAELVRELKAEDFVPYYYSIAYDADSYGSEPPESVPAGSAFLTVRSVTDYDYRELDEISVPALTDENSVDLVAEYAEYTEYQNALDAAYELTRNSYADDPAEYSGKTVAIKNAAAGVEGSATLQYSEAYNVDGRDDPRYSLFEEYAFLPVTDLCAIFDGLTPMWNAETMAVETESCSFYEKEIYPNADGIALYNDICFLSYYDADGSFVYDGSLTDSETAQRLYDYYGCNWINDWYYGKGYYFDENGRMYIGVAYFCRNYGYIFSFENGAFEFTSQSDAYSAWNEAVSEAEEKVRDNFFYKMDNNIIMRIAFPYYYNY